MRAKYNKAIALLMDIQAPVKQQPIRRNPCINPQIAAYMHSMHQYRAAREDVYADIIFGSIPTLDNIPKK